ncbi:hypothetical protein CDG81_12245 [Actinopolyspora erythraea]|uniref:DUF397 domain-containing protein n=1 Tax=Actinopolyspora erythraea TaxID=414996 RepID=A0A099D5Q0_9ACTN|nr:hypothetical protein CDG81_12245 [Actinopolyspora erythraea]KGI81266.1 hypothetical protein IL38_12320 [Actinopolyspora erythraea]
MLTEAVHSTEDDPGKSGPVARAAGARGEVRAFAVRDRGPPTGITDKGPSTARFREFNEAFRDFDGAEARGWIRADTPATAHPR